MMFSVFPFFRQIKAFMFLVFPIAMMLLWNTSLAQTCSNNGSVDNCGICAGGTTGYKPCKELPAGKYFIVAKHSNLCLQDATQVTQEAISNNPAKIWELAKEGAYYSIKNTATNRYLSVDVEPNAYVLSTFKGDNNAGMKLSIYTSKDGLNFNLLSDTGFEGTSSNLRDPSIMRHTDGRYYVAYTTAPTESCCGSQNYFSIASSTDLVHWTNHVNIPAGIANTRHTWAPEWYIEGNTVRIIASIETGDWQFRAYMFTAKDNSLSSWTEPAYMGIGPNYIDTYILKEGNTYHAFTKNETSKYLEHATASSLTGPWKFIATGNWSGWGSGVEGNNIVRLSAGGYRIFFDSQGTPFKYADSKDLLTWTAAQNVPNIFNIARHGTVINVSKQLTLSGAPAVSHTDATKTLWRLEEDGDYLNIIPASNHLLALDVSNESTSAGGNLLAYTRTGGDNQKFKMTLESVLEAQDLASELNLFEVQVAPNPFTDMLKVEVYADTYFDLYDAQGQIIESGNSAVPFFVGGSLRPGLYTLRLMRAENSKMLKVVKE